MKSILKYLGVVLFISLILTKASAFHIYEHHDTLNGQDNQCELCVLTIDSQHTETLAPSFNGLDENPVLVSHQPKIVTFNFQVVLSLSKTELFSRPPPTLL